MTRKDYQLIAKAFAFSTHMAAKYEFDTAGINFTIGCFTVELLEENPKFNTIKFLKAINEEIENLRERKVA